MRNITLKFNNPTDLIEFVELTETICNDLDHHELIITCTLSEADIELAKQAYHAVILNERNLN
jgi:hypothetical protein